MSLTDLPPFETHTIPRGSGSITVRDFPGAEPAFLLLHGFPDNSHIYDKLIPLLSQAGRRAIAIDFLGFGASDKPKDALYSFDQQLGDVEAVVAHLDLSHVIPVGHDAGGPAAVNFALRHPEQTAAVVMLNSFYGDAPGLLVPEMIDFFSIRRFAPLHKYIMASPEKLAWLFDFQRSEMQKGLSAEQVKVYDEFLGPIIDGNFKGGAVPAFAQMTQLLSSELEANTARLAELRKSQVPFVFVWGRTDPYLHVSVAEYMRSQVQKGTLHALEAGHWPQIDVADEVARIMTSIEQ